MSRHNLLNLMAGLLGLGLVVFTFGATRSPFSASAQGDLTVRAYAPGLAADSALIPTQGPVCGGTTAEITGLDKVGETVRVSGSGVTSGWYLISTSGNQRFDFPAGFILQGTVEIASGTPSFTNTATHLWWTSRSTVSDV